MHENISDRVNHGVLAVDWNPLRIHEARANLLKTFGWLHLLMLRMRYLIINCVYIVLKYLHFLVMLLALVKRRKLYVRIFDYCLFWHE
jgi:hypothetical protein